MDISRQLREQLLKHNMTMTSLSEHSNIPIETIRNIYYGKVDNPSLSTVMELSDNIGITIDELVYGNRHAVILTDNEKKCLDAYRSCSDCEKKLFAIMFRLASTVGRDPQQIEKRLVDILGCMVEETTTSSS